MTTDRLCTKLLLTAITVFFLAANDSPAYSAQATFYTLSNKFEKSGAPGKPKAAAIDESISRALSAQPESLTGFPAAPPIKKTISDIMHAGGTIDIEQGQSLYLRGSGIIKFIATEEGIVSIETIDKDNVRILGNTIGITFVHVWDSNGRNTFETRVTAPKFVISQSQKRQMEAFEKSRPFKFSYNNARTASYQGPKFRNRQRSSVDFNQNFEFDGDTPYGEVDGHAVLQKAVGKNVLTDGQVKLTDGKVGNFKNFNLALGDSRITPNLIVFPSGRVRGTQVEHWDDQKHMKWMGFYGKEQSSIIGTLTPGLISKQTPNSYLSGGVMDYKINDDAKIKYGQFFGQGRSRPDELNRQGQGVQGDFNFGPHVRGLTETNFDTEHFAHQHSLTTRLDKLTVRDEWRDVSKKFFTMLGAPSRQGEIGNMLEFSANPNESLYLTGSVDVFRDRLLYNPVDPLARNVHQELTMNYVPNNYSSWNFLYQSLDDTGRIGPTRQQSASAQYNYKFEIWGHKATIFARYLNRGNRILNDSLSNYVKNQGLVGFYMPIIWNINFSIQQEWNALKEPNINRFTRPRATTYSWDYNSQIGKTPFYMDSRLRIVDAEDTESQNSFMSGEDSTEISGGIYYREYEDLEIFLTGSFAQYNPESTNVQGHRIEAQFMTGMKYIFDSQIRWSTVGSFDGFVFKDLNGDGFRQPGEPGMAGMIIESAEGRKATTDALGYYELKQIEGKKAVLTLDSSKIPYGYAPTTAIRQEVLIEASKVKQVDFGLMPRSEVTGVIFNDLNGNGKYDINEQGVAKVKIKLDTGLTARSAGNGVYSFPDVVTGERAATIELATLPDGYLPLDAPKRAFTLYEGIRYELNFPLRAVRTINGRVFVDENNNGYLDKDERILPNVKVYLGENFVVTDQDGYYLFDKVNKGSYLLYCDEKSLPKEYAAEKTPRTIDFPAEPSTMMDINVAVKRRA